eukprot:5141553-Pleurochrysis_carterae.AAC.2
MGGCGQGSVRASAQHDSAFPADLCVPDGATGLAAAPGSWFLIAAMCSVTFRPASSSLSGHSSRALRYVSASTLSATTGSFCAQWRRKAGE